MENFRVKCVLTVLTFLPYVNPTQSLGAPTPKPIVFAEKVKVDSLHDILTYPARLVPTVNATILSETDGVVSQIVAPLGKSVSRNQRILIVKHTDPVYQYAPAIVTSPVPGVVSSVEVSEGSHITRGQRLAVITDPRKIRIIIEVALPDLYDIKPGLTGTLRVSGIANEISVRVVGISPSVDPATGTASCELATLSNHLLPPGLVGRIQFKVREHSGIQLPENAVIYRGKETFVRTVAEGKAKLTPVKIGTSRRGLVEIVNGIDENAVVVLRTSTFVSDGEEVQVENPKSSEG